MRLNSLAAVMLFILIAVLISVEIHRQVVLSRMVTQEQVESGWQSACIILTA